MNEDYLNLDYLRSGNARQKKLYRVIGDRGIFSALSAFDPVLVGTIPINIDIDSSDADIICYVPAGLRAAFLNTLQEHFNSYEGFEVDASRYGSPVICRFRSHGFDFEIFAQDIPVREQNAYRHMVIENEILCCMGEGFRDAVMGLKRQGIKTEPAFAKLLGLEGDPYRALLEYDPANISKVVGDHYR